MNSSKYETAIAKFDELNSQDPNRIESNGQLIAKELHDAEQMTKWVKKLYPDASESLLLAARCQHLCRWEIPRSTYPEGRTAYLKWRSDLKVFHADKSAAVLREVGYDKSVIEEVREMNLKKKLKSNPNVQAIEDALCMVFLEFQFESYLAKWERSKMIGIIQKTWAKMSETAHNAALELPFSDEGLDIIKEALASA